MGVGEIVYGDKPRSKLDDDDYYKYWPHNEQPRAVLTILSS